MPIYHLSPLAEKDLEDIWIYTAERWSVSQADSYIEDIIQAFENLAEGKRQGRPTDIRPGYLKYPVGAHVVFYKHHADHLDIIRILHGRMDVTLHL